MTCFLFVLLCFVLETGSFYIPVAVLKLTTRYVDQAGLELVEIALSLLPDAWD